MKGEKEFFLIKANQDVPVAKEHEEHRTKAPVSNQGKVQRHIFTSTNETLTLSTSAFSTCDVFGGWCEQKYVYYTLACNDLYTMTKRSKYPPSLSSSWTVCLGDDFATRE